MNIKIKVFDGSILNIPMNVSDTCDQLKEKIEKYLGFSTEEQKLVFENTILENDRKLISYGICNGSEVFFSIFLRKFLVTILYNQQKFEVTVNRNESVSVLKNEMHSLTGLQKAEQVLWYKEQTLNENELLSDYGIVGSCCILLIHKLRNEMEVFIKTLDGKTNSLKVQKTEKIENVKKKIQEIIGLVSNEQRISFQGVILEDDKTIDDYGIEEKSTINVIARLKNGLIIFITTIDGRTTALELQKTEKIIDVKIKIQEKFGFVTNEQILVFEGKLLEDDKTIDEYQITEESKINVVRLRNGIQIRAKTIDGNFVNLHVLGRYQIKDVKKQIQEKIGLESDDQNLIFQGRILDDDKTVDEYQIIDTSVINIKSLRIEIFVQTVDGTHSISISKREKIIDLKKKLTDKFRYPCNKQKLTVCGEILKDEKRIDEYSIKDQSSIDLKVSRCVTM